MAHLYGHEDAPCGQEEDVQTLSHDAQPQDSCRETEMKKSRGENMSIDMSMNFFFNRERLKTYLDSDGESDDLLKLTRTSSLGLVLS